MRKIDSIIIHCSATKAGQDFTAKDIDRWHRERGFNGIGYHYIIRLNGEIEKGRDISLPGAHCLGWNERSIGICYIGGLDANGNPADTRTNAQKRVLYQLMMDLQREYNILQVLGHRDTSPDLNGDGVIEPYEYVKACPCFSVKEFMRSGRELLFMFLLALFCPLLLVSCRSGKEGLNWNSKIEADSSSWVSHAKNRVEESSVSEIDSEVVEEHLEQMVYLFPLSGDTVMLRAGMVMKTVVDRKVGKAKKVDLGKSVMERDSVRTDYESRLRESGEMKRVEYESKGSWWWKGGCLLVGLVVGFLIYRWIRRLIS